MTNEQKLDEIYQIIKEQEARASRGRLFRILKWIFILGLIVVISQNPGIILNWITDLVMPTVMDNMKTMLEEDSASIMQQFKDILPKQP